jgi:general stress protein 26
MPTPQELRDKLWDALQSDRIVMLGVMGPEDPHKRPMAAQIMDDSTSIWFFGDNTTELAHAVSGGASKAEACFASKGHDLFACLHGPFAVEMDRTMIDALWSPQVSAWYPEGKDDPKLVLFRFDPSQAEIWDAESSLLASVKALFGEDPSEKSEAEKHATVSL